MSPGHLVRLEGHGRFPRVSGDEPLPHSPPVFYT